MRRLKNKKGFTLVELITVITIMGTLVLLAAPRFLGYTERAQIAELTSNVRVIQAESVKYYLNNEDWPRLTDEPYTSEEVEAFAERIYNLTGEEIHLDPNGKYYDIDFNKLSPNIQITGEKANYVLQNPAGKVYSLYNTTGAAADRVPSKPRPPVVTPDPPVVTPQPPIEGEVKPPIIEDNTVVDEEGIYTKDEIKDLIKHGYVGISTQEDLEKVRNNLGKKYIQTGNIDISGSNWTPIGNSSDEFEGTYDGGGFAITGLTINKPTSDYIGLFGRVDGATIKNVGLKEISVSGQSFAGGLVGYSEDAKVLDSYSTGSVEGSGGHIGGLVGYSEDSKVLNSQSAASVGGQNYVGGLAGSLDDSKVYNSYSTGSVKGRNYVGGLVSYNQESLIKDSYSTGSVTSTESYAGGLAGYNNGSKVEDSYSTGLVKGVHYVGGLTSYNYNSTVKRSYYDKQTSGQNTSGGGEGKSTTEMKAKSTYLDWDFSSIWEIKGGQYPTLR